MEKPVLAMLLLLSLSIFALAAYPDRNHPGTIVVFKIPLSLAFSMSMPSATASYDTVNSTSGTPGTLSSNIWFNASEDFGDSKLVQPCVQGGGCQGVGSNSSIFNYRNTGNVNLTIQLKLNDTMPAGIVLHWNSTATNGTAYAAAKLGTLNSTEFAVVVVNLTMEWTANASVWLFANFTSVVPSASPYAMRTITHNSTSSQYRT